METQSRTKQNKTNRPEYPRMWEATRRGTCADTTVTENIGELDYEARINRTVGVVGGTICGSKVSAGISPNKMHR